MWICRIWEVFLGGLLGFNYVCISMGQTDLCWFWMGFLRCLGIGWPLAGPWWTLLSQMHFFDPPSKWDCYHNRGRFQWSNDSELYNQFLSILLGQISYKASPSSKRGKGKFILVRELENSKYVNIVWGEEFW